MTIRAKQLISVVFSFRNEEAVLSTLIQRTDAVFSAVPEDYELIFVNDDSSDRSLEVLLSERQRNPRIRIVNMSRRFGVFECIVAGMAEASGDAVIYMDSDLQDPPEVIAAMLEQWRNGADVVHTVRAKRHGENPLKMWATRQAYRIVQFDSSPKLPVNAGDFKLLSRRVVSHVLSIKENDPYVRGLVVWIGYRQVFITYDRDARYAGRTHFPFFSRYPWKTFLLGITSFSFAPLYVIFAAGSAGIAAAFLLAIAGPWELALMTFFWGSTLAALGTVGIYVARIYKDVRGRPRYIVRERVGFGETRHSEGGERGPKPSAANSNE